MNMTSSARGMAVLLCAPLIGCMATDDSNPRARAAPAGQTAAATAATIFGEMHAAIPSSPKGEEAQELQ